MQIKYKLKFLSDWHIGSGTGIPGMVDNGVLKDSRNLPVVNGKTIKGITKDALEDILGMLHNFKKNSIPGNLIEIIFGGEGNREGNAIFYHPYICVDEIEYQSPEFRNFLDYYSGNTVGEVRFHTSIDENTGTALKNHLFSEEISDKEFQYIGEIRVDDQFAPYILAALRFVTKIGGKRRRGLGQCELIIQSPENYENLIREIFQ